MTEIVETPKKAATKSTKQSSAEKPKSVKQSFYFGTGRRKTAVARVKITLGKGDILVNDKLINDVFNDPVSRMIIQNPLEITDRVAAFTGTIKLAGGGIKAQAEAIAHGLSRALVAYDEALRIPLAKAGMMTRDPRMKERRKYGLAGKARRGKQSPKR